MVNDLHLSTQARSLWGKTDRADNEYWLPLYVHMADSVAMAEHLWDTWVPDGTKAIISRDLAGNLDLSRKVAVLLAGVHDIGKATPIFQSKPTVFGKEFEDNSSLAWKPRNAGLPVRDDFRNHSVPSHPNAGQVILEDYLQRQYSWAPHLTRSYASVVGGHHGTPPDSKKLDEARLGNPERMGYGAVGDDLWLSVQDELIQFVMDRIPLSPNDMALLADHALTAQSETILTGLTIMADWIASNSDSSLFPLVPLRPQYEEWEDEDHSWEGQYGDCPGTSDVNSWIGLHNRAEHAWANLGLCAPWRAPRADSKPMGELALNTWFQSRFTLPGGAKPRPVQLAALHVAMDVQEPGLMVIEAPMGEGKTEAALGVAEIVEQKTGRGGICVALPTMATTDAMFGRVHEWVNALPQDESASEKTMWLAHGKAQLNEEFGGIANVKQMQLSSVDADKTLKTDGRIMNRVTPEAVVSDWMWGRKKGVLANFLVCTVDQVLMGALQMKHVVLRQLALANKVVIIDECHAYDAYMLEYLKRVLEWLGGYGTPVILLSATLPEKVRQELVEAYILGKQTSQQLLESDTKAEPFRFHPNRKRRNNQPVLEPSIADPDARWHDAYPLITYSDGSQTRHLAVPPSSRTMEVTCKLLADDDDALLDLIDGLLTQGGCIGVVCDTVGRAQHVAALLGERLGRDTVRLTHSRFMDIDRMENERELRDLLGPKSTRANGKRPKKLVVVGTQVLEQSLDIDFDALITDIAPVDLLMQRIGRLHRHTRGQSEEDRPADLCNATCYIRGIEDWNDSIPSFNSSIKRVYEQASLLETMAVLQLKDQGAQCDLRLPADIAYTVRTAYGSGVRELIANKWSTVYDEANTRRSDRIQEKKDRASSYLMRSVGNMNFNHRTLTDWFVPQVDEADDDKGQRAVRDTQETVEVMLMNKDDDGVRLLPWVGDEQLGVGCGAYVPTNVIPPDGIARLAAQCSVRLPLAMCRLDHIDELIDALEEGCSLEAMFWRQSTWLAGKLALFLHTEADGSLSGEIYGFTVRYTRTEGLVVEKQDRNTSR